MATRPPSRPATRAPRHPARQRGPELKFRIRVVDGEAIAVGPGKIALLEAVEQAGSITAAARRLDMSYRRAWVLLDELNRSLKTPAVASATGGSAGGGTMLTDAGRELVALYRRIEATAFSANEADITRLMGLLRSDSASH